MLFTIELSRERPLLINSMNETDSKNSLDSTNSPNTPYESIQTDGNSRALSVCMLKGGVGKSTIAVNLARQLAAHDHDVLLIDLDPNGHASVGLGFDDQYHSTEKTIGNVFSTMLIRPLLSTIPPTSSIFSLPVRT
jgi:ATPases involved in chromosome partitioning